MARLIDEILLKGAKTGVGFQVADDFYDLLEQAEVFKVDNVAQYFASFPITKDWSISDFPNLAPPFEVYWIEHRGFPIRDEGEKLGTLYESCGVLFHATEVHPGDDLNFDGRHQISPDTRWVIMCMLVVKPEGATPFAMGARVLHVKTDGSLAGELDGLAILFDPEEMLDREGLAPNAEENCYRALEQLNRLFSRLCMYPTFLATSFLHCRNVRQVEGRITPKWATQYKRRYGRELVQFKTLDIGPITQVLRDAGAENKGTGLKKALHIARGHFATYTAEKPLFGKYAGRFWVPQHIRGRSSEGVVVKDYQVKAATEANSLATEVHAKALRGEAFIQERDTKAKDSGTLITVNA